MFTLILMTSTGQGPPPPPPTPRSRDRHLKVHLCCNHCKTNLSFLIISEKATAHGSLSKLSTSPGRGAGGKSGQANSHRFFTRGWRPVGCLFPSRICLFFPLRTS